MNLYSVLLGLWNKDCPVFGISGDGIRVADTIATRADLSLPGYYLAFDPTFRLAYLALDPGGLFGTGCS